jgi:putative ABC transport system ATP-binding protein
MSGVNPAVPSANGHLHTSACGRPVGAPVIAVRGVNFDFGSGESRSRVLFDVELEIGRGEVVIMTGPSGSGKTTLLTLIGALRHVQDGSLLVLGRELAGMDPAAQVRHRRDIGFIFQHHNLFSSLSARENVRMATALRQGTADEMDRRTAALLGRLGLADRLDYTPAHLSGGQRQRVAIGRALVNDPLLVLADEPTAALDAESGETVMSLLHELASGPVGSTVLIVTHDQRLIERADRIVSMVGGRVVSNVRPALSIRIVKALEQTKELAGLNEAMLARIADRMVVEYYCPGDVIVREGETGDRVYVVGEGVAEATKGDSPPRELDLGERVGRITAFSGLLVDETVRAKTDLELYKISQADFLDVLASDKTLEERIRLHYMSRQS